jgi:hypothetical protein
MARSPQDPPPATEAIHIDFDGFLKAAIYEFYRTSGKQRKGDFIALLIASGETLSVALDTIKKGATPRNIALGAAAVLALRVGLRYALSGPLGLLLAAGSAASLIAYFAGHRGQIISGIDRYRSVVDAVRTDYAKIQADLRDGRIDDAQQTLMIDGLLKRFLADLERS